MTADRPSGWPAAPRVAAAGRAADQGIGRGNLGINRAAGVHLWQPVSVHQPVREGTGGDWLDSAPDLSYTDGTQGYVVDVDHQPTDLVGWGFESLAARQQTCSSAAMSWDRRPISDR